MFWNERNLSKLSEILARKYHNTERSEWVGFLKNNDCVIVAADTIQDMCMLVNLHESIKEFVLVACDNDCEVILVPKDFAAAAVVLGDLPTF